jgi:hypothetical protein
MSNLDLSVISLTAAQRNFGWLAMFGFSTVLLCTWESVVMYVPLSNSLNKVANSLL